MKLPIRRVMAETHIKRIKKELEELDALEARAKHEPAGQRDETYLLMNYDEQRKKLLKELALAAMGTQVSGVQDTPTVCLNEQGVAVVR